MKTDLYTKVVLTIIAGCLVILVARNSDLVSRANATSIPSSSVQGLHLQEESSVIDVNIKSINGEPIELRKWGKENVLPVYVVYPPHSIR